MYRVVFLLMFALALSGCESEPRDFVVGRVVAVEGTLPKLLQSSGALFGNESVKLGDGTLILQIQAENEIYFVEVKKIFYMRDGGQKTVNNIFKKIESGASNIRFPRIYYSEGVKNHLCSAENLCVVDPDLIFFIG